MDWKGYFNSPLSSRNGKGDWSLPWRRGRGNGVCLATTSPQNDTGKKREHFEHILLSANWQYYIPARPSFPPSTLTNLKKTGERERERESGKGWKVLWAAYEGEYSKIIQPFVRVPLCVNKDPFVEYGFFAEWRIQMEIFYIMFAFGYIIVSECIWKKTQVFLNFYCYTTKMIW